MLTRENLQLTRVHELLEKSGIACTYSSLRRFGIREGLLQGKVRDTVRMVETGPGEVMELDFGRLGEIWDADAGVRKTVSTMQTVRAFSRHLLIGPQVGKFADHVWGISVIVNTTPPGFLGRAITGCQPSDCATALAAGGQIRWSSAFGRCCSVVTTAVTTR